MSLRLYYRTYPKSLHYSWLHMLHYGRVHWRMRERESTISVVCFQEMGNGVWQCPCQYGRTEKSWYVCEPGGVCTLWHCHWSSLASCSEMQGTDKDFIQLFLTHKHTTLCLSLHVYTKQFFRLHSCSLTFTLLTVGVSALWYQVVCN